jgi:hypothetical protein
LHKLIIILKMVKACVHHHVHYDASGEGFKDAWNKVKKVAAPIVKLGANKAKDYAVSKAKEYGDQYGVGDLAGAATGKLADYATDKTLGTGLRQGKLRQRAKDVIRQRLMQKPQMQMTDGSGILGDKIRARVKSKVQQRRQQMMDGNGFMDDLGNQIRTHSGKLGAQLKHHAGKLGSKLKGIFKI